MAIVKCLGFLLLLLLIGCAATPNPKSDVCFFTMTPPSKIIPICIKAGEFDLSEKERGYRTFESREDLIKYLRNLLGEKM